MASLRLRMSQGRLWMAYNCPPLDRKAHKSELVLFSFYFNRELAAFLSSASGTRSLKGQKRQMVLHSSVHYVKKGRNGLLWA